MLAVTVKGNSESQPEGGKAYFSLGFSPWLAGFVALEQNIVMASAVLGEQSRCPHGGQEAGSGSGSVAAG